MKLCIFELPRVQLLVRVDKHEVLGSVALKQNVHIKVAIFGRNQMCCTTARMKSTCSFVQLHSIQTTTAGALQL